MKKIAPYILIANWKTTPGTLRELEQLQKDILSSDSIKSITYSHKQLTDLVNLKWIFGIIILLLSIEWFLRKHNGKV